MSVIRTPDQRLRIFVSSTLGELADERAAVKAAVERLHLAPVMFEIGARPHPPRELYRAYLEQSHVFVGIYWQRYGWVAPGEDVSGLEDEFHLAGNRPKLIYIKEPAPDREPRLVELLSHIRDGEQVSYKRFNTSAQLAALVADDLMLLLTERFGTGSDEDAATRRPSIALAPTVVTTTVGRDGDVDAVIDRLVAGARLITLTGVGGLGKTRLALEVAARAASRRSGPVRFVALDAVTDASKVVPAIAERLGVRVEGNAAPLDALTGALAGTDTLLILDNFEQVIDAAGELTDLLARCTDLQLLVTSRQALRIAAEQEYPVAPLELADPFEALDDVAEAPATRLLLDRARAARPGFAIDAHNVDDVVEVCRLLDGVPLAIVLAAARLRVLSPAQLRERLAHGLDLLVGGTDLPPRQRTLRATINWSHELLDGHARRLFAELSVFVGGFTLEAAEAVCTAENAPPVIDTLATLIDHSLVGYDDGANTPRFRMLETVRAFAAERLEEQGDGADVRARHLAWFRRFTDAAQPYLCGPAQLDWAALVDPERGNLRAAIAHALEVGDVTSVVEMTWDVLVYYHLRGAPDEPSGWLQQALEQRGGLDERCDAILETALAVDEVSRGDFTRARQRLEPALDVFTARRLTFDASVADMYLGLVALRDGDLSGAVAAEQRASEGFASVGHEWGVASAECFTGFARWVEGHVAQAAEHYHRGLDAAQRIANEQLAAQALVGLAMIDLGRRDDAAALEQLVTAGELLERCHDARVAALCLDAVAALAVRRADVMVAAEALTAAAVARERLGLPPHPAVQARIDAMTAAVQERLGDTYTAAGEAARRADPFTILRTTLEVLTGRDPLPRAASTRPGERAASADSDHEPAGSGRRRPHRSV